MGVAVEGGYFLRYFLGPKGRTFMYPVFPWMYRTFKGEGTPYSLRLIRRIDSKKKKKNLPTWEWQQLRLQFTMFNVL